MFRFFMNSKNENAHLLKKLEDYHHDRGIPVDANVKVCDSAELKLISRCIFSLTTLKWRHDHWGRPLLNSRPNRERLQ